MKKFIGFFLGFLIILFPFFFLTTTQEFYLINKLYLLAFGAILFLLFSTIHLLSSKKIAYKKNDLDLPIILFFLTVAISIIISSPNKVQALLNPNFGLVSILSLTIVYFYISRMNNGEWRGDREEAKIPVLSQSPGGPPARSVGVRRAKNMVSSVLPITGLILSFITIILFFQPLKNLTLPQNLEFLKSPSFTPLGSPLDLAIFLGFFTILGLTQILKQINTKIRYTIYFLLPLIALTLTVYNILKPASGDQFQLILTPFRYSWYAAVETLKNPLTALFGIGIDNFSSIFTKIKDVNYNLSSYWSINSFLTSRSTILHILTETGFFGLTAFSLIILTLFNMILSPARQASHSGVAGGDKKQIHTDDTKYQIPNTCLPAGMAIYVLIIMLLFPPSLPVFFLFYITLSFVIASPAKRDEAISSNDHVIASPAESDQIVYNDKNKTLLLPELVAYTITILSLLFIGFSTYFLTRSYSAEYYYKKSIEGYQKNNLKLLYDNQQKAISLNPYIEKFRINFAQTNLILVDNLASKGDQITEVDRSSAAQAVQAAINEAKAVTTLNPQKAVNWENLAVIYRNILNIVQGADVWTVSAYQRAINLDPQNPSYRLSLGGLYYAFGKYDDANRFFEQAVGLKPDWANAYYNLAWSSYKKEDYKTAVNAMQNAISLVNPQVSKTDYERAKTELEDFKKMLPEEETATESSEVDKPELNLPSLAPTQSQPIVEITP